MEKIIILHRGERCLECGGDHLHAHETQLFVPCSVFRGAVEQEFGAAAEASFQDKLNRENHCFDCEE